MNARSTFSTFSTCAAASAVFLILLFGAAQGSAQERAAPPGTYVGDETCATCHDELATGVASTAHGSGGFAALSPNGCETCHGPGSLHAEDPDDESLRPRIVEDEITTTCLSCHRDGGQMFWEGSKHATRGLACTSCHSVHGWQSDDAQLIAASAAEQCYTCHKEVRAEAWKTSHHPIREGKVSCADCHNPHGTQTAKMISAVSINEQCYSCHAEKRGPFIWEHAPVRESCLNCHVPHGSNHLKLQRTSVPYICQQCHSNTRHPGTLYDAFRLPTLEDEGAGSNRLFNRACLDCHPAIHGSNHPSSPYLGR